MSTFARSHCGRVTGTLLTVSDYIPFLSDCQSLLRHWSLTIEGMKKRIECSVFGRVQLVMYRDFATRKARGLGVVGEVANRADGSVRVVAEGEERALLDFIKELNKGSLLSHVEEVDVTWREATGEFADFTIDYSGRKI